MEMKSRCKERENVRLAGKKGRKNFAKAEAGAFQENARRTKGSQTEKKKKTYGGGPRLMRLTP